MKVAVKFAEVRDLTVGKIGLVPTMGYFHEGHLALMEAAREACDTLVVSLFVNPLQFNDRADLDRYPRDLERDTALAEQQGVDVLFVPALEEMYSDSPLTSVKVASITDRMEGQRRPGHFEGVATVVAKLFAGLRPDLAFFGRKDAQQLAVVRRMAFDLSLPVAVVGCPIVREHDGIALSSRNVFLTEGDRKAALGLSGGLFAVAEAVESGERSGPALERLAVEVAAPLELEYAELVSADLVERMDVLDRPGFLALAALVGGVRLIDNLFFDLGLAGELRPDRGIRLSEPSALYGRR